MKLFIVDNEHYKLTIVIVLLNVLIITECVVLLVRATNPFFTSSDHPTSAFALFLAVQITAAAVLSVGICAAKDKMVLLNRGLFKTVAFTNAVYAIIFFVRKDVLAGFVMSFLVLINALGSLVCRRFFLHLTWNQQLPTTAPSSNQQLPTTVPSLNLNNTRV
ncbi:hypothetical protein Poli38472_001057 [Pythium oligandrum]|uniref:Uncharacterized protein n=1 Tax=Pythium oligandrum TaxID=41045 RepID=A0A8K1CS94_PYTOL|nr:hypothetical protein Poli38472_001057 [Pythium oligandrum]|eukprot:TMW68901.1 hypothetical protein Poli38472_001057 [Pythium oligandrum]